MISSLWPPAVLGGAEVYAASLAEHLRGRGWDVGALTLGVAGDDVVVSVRPWPYRLDEFEAHSRATRAVFHALDVYRPDVTAAVRRAIDEFGPGVVHSHSVAGLSTAVLTAPSRCGIAHVHTLHDYWLLCRRSSLVKSDGTACVTRCGSCQRLSDLRERVVRRHPPHVVIAVSNAIARAHESIEWMRDRLRVVRNPVTRMRGTSERTGSAPGPVTFGYLGRLTRAKGIAALVRAFLEAGLASSARLLVAGDGPMRVQLEGEQLPGVELLGWVDGGAKDAFFARVDCLVVPSEWEDPAPLVIDEARGRGIPVIGARAGGIPELVAPSGEALLFPPGDVSSLARSLQRFAADPSDFADDGADLTGWEQHLDAVVAAYDDAIAAR